jgi:hypothetical protein
VLVERKKVVSLDWMRVDHLKDAEGNPTLLQEFVFHPTKEFLVQMKVRKYFSLFFFFLFLLHLLTIAFFLSAGID